MFPDVAPRTWGAQVGPTRGLPVPVSMVMAGPRRLKANASRPAATDRLTPVAENADTLPASAPAAAVAAAAAAPYLRE